MVAPSTAATGAGDMIDHVLGGLAGLRRDVRVVVSGLGIDDSTVAAICVGAGLPAGAVVAGLARQDQLLASGAVDVLICGGGHGILAKSLTHGVPVVTIPGGGDQWELANRVSRIGVGELVRPVTADTVTGAVRTVLDDPGYGPGRVGRGISQGTVDPVTVVDRVLGRSGAAPADRTPIGLDAVRLTEFTELMNAQFGVCRRPIRFSPTTFSWSSAADRCAGHRGRPRPPHGMGSQSAATSTCPANAGSPHSMMPVKALTSEDLRLWRTLACGEPRPVENLGLRETLFAGYRGPCQYCQ